MNATRPIVLLLATLLAALGAVAAPPAEELPRIEPTDPGWQELAAQLGRLPDGVAAFEEERIFGIRARPVRLAGVARVSRHHGLSLEYTGPEPRIVIVDRGGVLFREQGRDRPAPADPRARVMNEAMLRLLRFDLGALAGAFALRGRIDDTGWQLALRPKDPESLHLDFALQAAGDAAGVRQIEVHQRGRRTVEIRILPPRAAPGGFPPEEVRRYFRGPP